MPKTRTGADDAVPCALCGCGIGQYDPAFHRLRVRDDRAVDVCDTCIERFVAWQSATAARLFPTRAMQRLHRAAPPGRL